jgi:hypothetical protein
VNVEFGVEQRVQQRPIADRAEQRGDRVGRGAADRLAAITGFPSPDLFERFGLPPRATEVGRALLIAVLRDAG